MIRSVSNCFLFYDSGFSHSSKNSEEPHMTLHLQQKLPLRENPVLLAKVHVPVVKCEAKLVCTWVLLSLYHAYIQMIDLLLLGGEYPRYDVVLGGWGVDERRTSDMGLAEPIAIWETRSMETAGATSSVIAQALVRGWGRQWYDTLGLMQEGMGHELDIGMLHWLLDYIFFGHFNYTPLLKY